MKKITMLICAILISNILVLDVKAEESFQVLNGVDNELYSVEEENQQILNYLSKELDYIVEYTEIDSDLIVRFYNKETYEYLGGATYHRNDNTKVDDEYNYSFFHNVTETEGRSYQNTKQKLITPLSLIDTYDVFKENWGLVLSREVTISWTAQTTLNIIITILTANFSIWASVGVTIINALAQKVYDNRYAGLYARYYIRQNLHCSILRHEQVKFYSNSNYTNLVRTQTSYGVWLANPWDYTGTVEYACRVLTERY